MNNNTKKQFDAPEMKIVSFNTTDIIRTSGEHLWSDDTLTDLYM